MYSATASNTQTKKHVLSYYREERQKCDTIHETQGTVSVLPQFQAQRRERKYDTPKSKIFLTDFNVLEITLSQVFDNYMLYSRLPSPN